MKIKNLQPIQVYPKIMPPKKYTKNNKKANKLPLILPKNPP